MASNFRPYYPRVQNRPQQSDDVTRGMAIGSAFGKDIQGLGTALAQGIAQQKQNQVANQLLNQDYPSTPADPNLDPDADLSTDLPEDVSTDVGGTASPGQQGNFQGGQAELALRMANAKEQMSMQELQAKIAQSKAATALAGQKAAGVRLGGGSSSRWLAGNTGQTGQAGTGPRGRGTTKPAAYVAGSGDVQNDESTDNFSQIRTDFDNQYGKGAFDKFQGENGGTEVLDKDGNLTGYSVGGVTSTDANGNPVVKKAPMATVPVQDAPLWMQRVNAARIKVGQQPVEKMIGKDSVYGQPQNPTSTAKAGTPGNPIVVDSKSSASKLQIRGLPYNTVIYDPNTQQTYTKQKPPTQ
jgi:hypothetical protein